MTELYSEEEVSRIIKELSKDIATTCKTPFALIGIETKGHILSQRIKSHCDQLTVDTIPIGLLDIALYSPSQSQSDFVSVGHSSIPFSLKDKTIILVADEIDTGKTVTAALNALSDYEDPSVIKCCCLLNKNNLTRPIHIEYIGFDTAPGSPGYKEKTKCLFYETDGEEYIKIDQ